MRSATRCYACIAAGLLTFSPKLPATRGQSPSANDQERTRPKPGLLSLANYNSQESETIKQSTTETSVMEDDWEIDGPVFLRAATPEPPGEVIIKNIFAWEHSKKSGGGGGWFWGSDGDDDDRDEYEYELEIEWGIVENHELIFEMPWQIGDGRVDGNGDLTLGWHWRLWQEEGNWPAFALRNYVRLPSGVDSSGVDYELRGLITKTLVPGSTRLHINPFAKSVNGNNEEDAEPFQYGAAVGVDHRLSDNLLFITDYIYHSEETEDAVRANHSAEFGLDWSLAEHQKLGLAFLVGLDGDTEGPEYGARVSYMISFGP